MMGEGYSICIMTGVMWVVGVVVVVGGGGGRGSAAAAVPAIYVFGDSLSDSGNNNGIQTAAKSNYAPYGCDFPGGPSGRFTNGKNFADFLAEKLGLPLPPAFMGLSEEKKSIIRTGINYASGGCGILEETGKPLRCLPLGKQVELFETTVEKYLKPQFENKEDLHKELAKSIFLVAIGSNDYINNYLQPSYNTSHRYNSEEFSHLLIENISQRLQKLYQLGARKFAVFDAGRPGCVPGMKTLNGGQCLQVVNYIVNLYNSKLPKALQILQSQFEGSTIVHVGDEKLDKVTVEHPSKYGFKLPNEVCCELNEVGCCAEGGKACSNRDELLYFDSLHPSQKFHSIIADFAYDHSPSTSAPITIRQLAKL